MSANDKELETFKRVARAAAITYVTGRCVLVIENDKEKAVRRRKINEATALLPKTGASEADLDKVLADQVKKCRTL